jgi:hypothetical protein
VPTSRVEEKNRWVEAECKRCNCTELLLHTKKRVITLGTATVEKMLEEKYVCKECRWYCEGKRIESLDGCEHCKKEAT